MVFALELIFSEKSDFFFYSYASGITFYLISRKWWIFIQHK